MRNFLRRNAASIAYVCYLGIIFGALVWAFEYSGKLKYIYDPTTGLCFVTQSGKAGITDITCSDQVLEQAGALKPTARF